MHKIGFAIVAAASILASAPVNATVVTGSFAGTVTGGSGDFNGLFGTTGSIAGTAITGTFRYDTANFFTPSPTCTVECAAWDSTDGSMAPGTITMTETINGVTLSWNGVYYNDLLLAYSTTGGSWQYGYLHQAFEIVAEQSTAFGTTTNAAQLNLGTFDNSVSIVNSALDPNGPFNLQAFQFVNAGSNWNTPTSNVQWSFSVDTVSAPEPATLVLFAVGIAGVAVARRRRA